MRFLRRFFARFSNLAAGRRADQRLREEMEEHLAQQTSENLRSGLSPDEARRQAVIKFGAVQAIREEYHDELSLPFIETLLRDLRYAIRQLADAPGSHPLRSSPSPWALAPRPPFTASWNATLLHPLPYPEPDQLVRIQEDFPGIGAHDVRLSVPEWKDFQSSGIFQYVAPVDPIVALRQA